MHDATYTAPHDVPPPTETPEAYRARLGAGARNGAGSVKLAARRDSPVYLPGDARLNEPDAASMSRPALVSE